MVTLEESQAALISYLKNYAPLITALTTANPNSSKEIRELEWQGTGFSYPCVRVRIDERNDQNESNCEISNLKGTIMVFSLLDSSLEANQLASIIFNGLSRKSFSVGTVKFTGFRCTQLGANKQEKGDVWLSELRLEVKAS